MNWFTRLFRREKPDHHTLRHVAANNQRWGGNNGVSYADPIRRRTVRETTPYRAGDYDLMHPLHPLNSMNYVGPAHHEPVRDSSYDGGHGGSFDGGGASSNYDSPSCSDSSYDSGSSCSSDSGSFSSD